MTGRYFGNTLAGFGRLRRTGRFHGFFAAHCKQSCACSISCRDIISIEEHWLAFSPSIRAAFTATLPLAHPGTAEPGGGTPDGALVGHGAGISSHFSFDYRLDGSRRNPFHLGLCTAGHLHRAGHRDHAYAALAPTIHAI